MIQVNYKLSEQEIYKSLLDISKSRVITNVMRIVGFVLLAVMLFLITAGLRRGGFALSLGNVFPIFLALYLIFLSEVTAKFQAPSLVKNKNPFAEQTQVKIYETGFRVKGETFNNQFQWEKLNSIIESPNFFLFKETEVLATVIPKRVLTGEEITQLKGIISKVTGPKITMM